MCRTDADQSAADEILSRLAEDDGELGALASLCRELISARDKEWRHVEARTIIALTFADQRLGAAERDATSIVARG